MNSSGGSALIMSSETSLLIVDDDIEMTDSLCDILEDSGYDVEVAADGFKAMERVKARAFDAILMDIKMPGINGVKTYKEIKVIRPEAAVMMMTARVVVIARPPTAMPSKMAIIEPGAVM